MSDPSDVTGTRSAFLDRIRSRQGRPVSSGPHPPPPSEGAVPVMRYRSLDGIDAANPDALVDTFVEALVAASASVEQVSGPVTIAHLRGFVHRHGVQRAVVSAEGEVAEVGRLLREMGITVSDYDRASGAAADLAVTSATAGIAATGSLVVDTATARSRAVSALPRTHLCVISRSRLVATPSDVLRSQGTALPSCRVLITGPSRTGDIEQLLTLGAHGPVALHVLLTD